MSKNDYEFTLTRERVNENIESLSAIKSAAYGASTRACCKIVLVVTKVQQKCSEHARFVLVRACANREKASVHAGKTVVRIWKFSTWY